MRRRALIAFALFLFAATWVPGTRAAEAAGPSELSGSVPSSGGFALVVWSGGPIERMRAVLSPRGCEVASAWVTDAGALIGYVPGAPAVVNDPFVRRFPGAVVPTSTIVITVCNPGAVSQPAAGAQLLGANVQVQSAAGVTPEDISLVRSGATLAQQYFIDKFGSGVLEPSLLELFATSADPANPGLPTCCFTTGGRGGFASEVRFYTAHAVWKMAATGFAGSPWPYDFRPQVSAHEYVHVWQREIGCTTAAMPEWIIEGTAEYLSFEAWVRSGAISVAKRHDFEVYQSSGVPASVPFNTFEARGTLSRYPGSYGLAALAIERLVQGNPQAPHDFCVDVATGTDWQVAFRRAFGVTPAQFYVDFEAARLTLK